MAYSFLSGIECTKFSMFQTPWRLRCLPAFYLLGASKSGTSDLYEWMLRHPHVHGGITKEQKYWNGLQNTQLQKATLREYVDQFDEAAEKARISTQTVDHQEYHPVAIVDGTPRNFWARLHWKNMSENKRRLTPKHTSPEYIKQLTPNTQFILILRNPTDRVYSAYKFLYTVYIRQRIARLRSSM